MESEQLAVSSSSSTGPERTLKKPRKIHPGEAAGIIPKRKPTIHTQVFSTQKNSTYPHTYYAVRPHPKEDTIRYRRGDLDADSIIAFISHMRAAGDMPTEILRLRGRLRSAFPGCGVNKLQIQDAYAKAGWDVNEICWLTKKEVHFVERPRFRVVNLFGNSQPRAFQLPVFDTFYSGTAKRGGAASSRIMIKSSTEQFTQSWNVEIAALREEKSYYCKTVVNVRLIHDIFPLEHIFNLKRGTMDRAKCNYRILVLLAPSYLDPHHTTPMTIEMSKKLVLVTGISGFIGGHVAEELLRRGFQVRGVLRSARYHTFTNTIKVPGLEFVEVDDIVNGDFTEALKGVYGAIHIACPLPGRNTQEELESIAVQGTLNLVRQAQQAGVRKIVVTSTFGSLLSLWGESEDTELEKNKEDKFYTYFDAKLKAEKALWAFAAEHPELEVATILPGFALGPYAKTFPLPSNMNNMATNIFVRLILNKYQPPFSPGWLVNVRDIAKAHVRALEALPLPNGDPKRFIANGATYAWADVAAYIKKSRPELADRVLPLEGITPLPGVLSTLDTTRAREVLGIEFIPVEKTIDEAVDAVLALDNHWSKAKN
ncbi:Putative uncharacterized oxidoreductase [Psilocybe cubensis]|uniref:Uncharacterized oxidoreductase n=1 Tax=Psilocybe cubensis TaxID=181762 RepID=A0ACB8GNG5_PSICU|nr:Putative uncharacterized oxidoreductase [Psilocybe cubensis]KAH9477015.1 Putative uncharacterized oxidoreductase [Psilocybe cubensis]